MDFSFIIIVTSLCIVSSCCVTSDIVTSPHYICVLFTNESLLHDTIKNKAIKSSEFHYNRRDLSNTKVNTQFPITDAERLILGLKTVAMSNSKTWNNIVSYYVLSRYVVLYCWFHQRCICLLRAIFQSRCLYYNKYCFSGYWRVVVSGICMALYSWD